MKKVHELTIKRIGVTIPEGFIAWHIPASCTCHHSGCRCDDYTFGIVLIPVGYVPVGLKMCDSRGIWTVYKDCEEVSIPVIEDIEYLEDDEYWKKEICEHLSQRR